MRVEEGLQLPAFERPHPYAEDTVLPSLLRRLLPTHLRAEVENDLLRWGEEIRGPIQALGALCDATKPALRQYNQWGQRIDELTTSEGWRALKAVTFREGLVNIAYDRARYAQWARVYCFAKIVMFNGDCRSIMCPFSMTDGCARVLELYGTKEMQRDILPRLLTRNPSQGFTAGQWMTERPGGSDLTNTETKAAKVASHEPSAASFGAEEWELDGFKWFSSATDGDLSLALARTGPESAGARALSLFLVPFKLPLISPPAQNTGTESKQSNNNNNILVHRLKNKIGTHDLPTAELSLNGTRAYRVGALNQGIRTIAPVLNITRLHSSMSSLGYLSRALQIATSYASARHITGAGVTGRGTLLRDLPLHTHTLAKVSVLYRALMHLAFGAVVLLGKAENGSASEEEAARLRLLTPLVKGYVATYAVGGMEECMVALGGQGYMEENEIGRMIRDGLVEKIWEGTANIMALDVIRACRGGQSARSFGTWGKSVLAQVPKPLQNTAKSQLDWLRTAVTFLERVLLDTSLLPSPILPRPIFFLLGQTASALFLLEHATWSASEESVTESEAHVAAFTRWVDEGPAGSSLVETQSQVERLWKEHRAVSNVDEALVYPNRAGSVGVAPKL